MKMDVGKYRGRELSELPSGYLEWALGHLALGDEMARSVMAEYARRRNAERVAAETPAEHALGRAGRPVNRVIAHLHSRLLSCLRVAKARHPAGLKRGDQGARK